MLIDEREVCAGWGGGNACPSRFCVQVGLRRSAHVGVGLVVVLNFTVRVLTMSSSEYMYGMCVCLLACLCARA